MHDNVLSRECLLSLTMSLCGTAKLKRTFLGESYMEMGVLEWGSLHSR